MKWQQIMSVLSGTPSLTSPEFCPTFAGQNAQEPIYGIHGQKSVLKLSIGQKSTNFLWAMQCSNVLWKAQDCYPSNPVTQWTFSWRRFQLSLKRTTRPILLATLSSKMERTPITGTGMKGNLLTRKNNFMI